jgi:arsenate reductase
MKSKVYTYRNCDTCRKAIQFLTAKGVEYQEIPIREQPPTKSELKRMLEHYGGDLRKLFNTSGMDYKVLNLKDKLPSLSPDEAIALLNQNGNLVKRPFLLAGDQGLVGFKEAEWSKIF